jgi:hypothetical protein
VPCRRVAGLRPREPSCGSRGFLLKCRSHLAQYCRPPERKATTARNRPRRKSPASAKRLGRVFGRVTLGRASGALKSSGKGLPRLPRNETASQVEQIPGRRFPLDSDHLRYDGPRRPLLLHVPSGVVDKKREMAAREKQPRAHSFTPCSGPRTNRRVLSLPVSQNRSNNGTDRQ